MISPKLSIVSCALLSVVCVSQAMAQATPPKVDKSTAYYHFTLGHLYSELAAAYGNRGGDYLKKAIENYKLAMKATRPRRFWRKSCPTFTFRPDGCAKPLPMRRKPSSSNPSDLNARRLLGRIYTRMVGDAQQGKVNEDMLKRAIEQYQKVVEASSRTMSIRC